MLSALSAENLYFPANSLCLDPLHRRGFDAALQLRSSFFFDPERKGILIDTQLFAFPIASGQVFKETRLIIGLDQLALVAFSMT